MSAFSVLEIVGFFLMGMLFGMLGFRELIRFVQERHFTPAPCGLCAATVYLVSCDRCQTKIGMCHCYVVMGTDDSSVVKLHRRRKSHLCVRCLTPAEKEFLEELLHP